MPAPRGKAQGDAGLVLHAIQRIAPIGVGQVNEQLVNLSGTAQTTQDEAAVIAQPGAVLRRAFAIEPDRRESLGVQCFSMYMRHARYFITSRRRLAAFSIMS